MKKRSLNTREKRLLTMCVLTLVVVGNVLVIREFMNRRKEAVSALASLKDEETMNRLWMNDSALYQKRLAWLNSTMPYTPSEGKSRGELYDDLTQSARDVGLNTDNENPQESLALELDNKDLYANEVSVSMRIKGDHNTMLKWLLTLQAHDRFVVIKDLQLEPDSRSKEKTPQAQCNITVARWFNPNPPPGGVPPAVTPAPVTAPVAEPAGEIPNPLEIGSPLDGVVPPSPSA